MADIGNINMQNAYSAVDTRAEKSMFNNAIRDLRQLGYSGKAQMNSAGQILNKEEILSFIGGLNKDQITKYISELYKYLQPSPAPSDAKAETIKIQNPSDFARTVQRVASETTNRNAPSKTYNIVLPSGNYYTVDTGNSCDALSVVESLEVMGDISNTELPYENIRSLPPLEIATILSQRKDRWDVLNRLMGEDLTKGISVFHNISPQSQGSFVAWLIKSGNVPTCNAMFNYYKGSPAEGRPEQMRNVINYLGFMVSADSNIGWGTLNSLISADPSSGMNIFHVIGRQSQNDFVAWLVKSGNVSTCKAMLNYYEGSSAEGKPTQYNNILIYLSYADSADRGAALQLFNGLQPSTQNTILDNYYQSILAKTDWTDSDPDPFVQCTALFFTALQRSRPADAQYLMAVKQKMSNSEFEYLAKPWKNFLSKISPQTT